MREKIQKSSYLLTVVMTCLTLIAFAANSVLCRLALGDSNIDPAGFTAIRMISGAFMLALIVLLSRKQRVAYQRFELRSVMSLKNTQGWISSAMLFGYAVFFSFAYVRLDTASGALILFATVQLFMIGVGIVKGQHLTSKEWLGVMLSFAGFVYLMLPSATQPSLVGFLLMLIAGVFWAFYSLLGRYAQQPVMLTAENFIRCIPIALICLWFSLFFYSLSWEGVWYAVASGAVASGLGYSLWYLVLTKITITQAAISQLTVPLIAALGGVIFINEPVTTELIISASLILFGIFLVSVKPKQSD
ncbi:DMT family transporter [Colwellia sp. KU-HH00111]|uniref:DMT family transporter n=1 Tax=Colwellia sp. KU-HH00111 TaxID=3127652 RepID=UPI00310B6F71